MIQVSLSHDMVGYDGVETLVYRALAKVMEQIEGGTLVLNKGAEEKRAPGADGDEERDLAWVEGLEAGWKLAEVSCARKGSRLVGPVLTVPPLFSSQQANLDQLIKTSYDPATANAAPSDNSITIPVTNCPIFLRIQPCLAPLPFHPTPAPTGTKEGHALFFLLLLKDPGHSLSHASISQSIPGPWLDIPFEENEWVEDVMVEVIRRGVEIVGQECECRPALQPSRSTLTCSPSACRRERQDACPGRRDHQGKGGSAADAGPAAGRAGSGRRAGRAGGARCVALALGGGGGRAQAGADDACSSCGLGGCLVGNRGLYGYALQRGLSDSLRVSRRTAWGTMTGVCSGAREMIALFLGTRVSALLLASRSLSDKAGMGWTGNRQPPP